MKNLNRPLLYLFSASLLFMATFFVTHLKAQPYNQYALLPEQLLYDVKFYDLGIVIDVNTHSISGVTRIQAEILQNNTSQIVLNFYNIMNIDSIVYQNQLLTYSHHDNILRTDLPLPLGSSDTFSVRVYYHGNPLSYPPYSSGLNFVDYLGQRLIYSLNWPYFACSYFPCKDHPSDKADSVRIAVTVPASHIVGSTGQLVSTQSLPGNYLQYIWESHYPVAPYNICINAYPFDSVNSVYNSALSGTIPLEFYMFPHHTASALPRLQGEVPRIIEAFESYYGPFPFPNDKFGVCELSMSGFGMEHQTLLTMNYSFFFDIELPHEGAHEWFGNMIAIADWGDIWLSEGFATYGQAIFREYWEGPAGYQQEISSHMASSGSGTIFVSEPWDPQNLIPLALVYNKASTVLHMLRFVMGDSLFLDMLKDYATLSAFRHGNVNTAQFEVFCESYYGQDLSWFFDQWIYRDGKMSLEYYAYWNLAADSLIFKAHSTPSIGGTYHAMPVPVQFNTASIQFLDTLLIDSLNLTQRYEFSDTSGLEILIDPGNKLLKGQITYLDHPVLESAAMNQDSVVVRWSPFFDFPEYEVHLWRKDNSGNFVFISSLPVSGYNLTFKPSQAGTYRVAVLAAKDGHQTGLSEFIEVNYTTFPMDLDILVVDETRNGSGSSMLDPTDEVVDLFYDSILLNYAHDQLDVITAGRAPDVFDFAHYKLVIWHYDVASQTVINESLAAIRAYLEAGGTIIFSGINLLTNLSSDFTAPYLGYTQTTVNPVADYSGALGLRGYSDIPLDTFKITIPSYNNRLRFVSIFDTTSARAIYQFLSHSANPQFHNKACGIVAPSVANSTRSGVISLGFPLYFTQIDSARNFMFNALEELIQVSKITEESKLKLSGFRLVQNYPNPFNPVTVIGWHLATNSTVKLTVYNITGQKVAILVNEKQPAGYHSFVWNASQMASGVYLYRLQAGDHIEARKMMLLR
ncbi:MAG: T9SS type A sorting domain-containing protein [bacterium]|nr:MAG: T9SS type A sorting domain-containing protein [bacterium]